VRSPDQDRAGGPARIERRQVALAVVVAVLATLSYVIRIPCIFTADPSGLALAVPACHGDLEAMWFFRGLGEGYVPYLQPFLDPRSGQLVTVEYPVLTGMLMWLAALPGSFGVFVALSTALGAAAAVGVALVLERRCGVRAWLWAAAPALLHYLAYNYDTLPALSVVVALVMVLGRDPVTVPRARLLGAAAVLGVGGALKFYPLLFVLPLALWLLFGSPGRQIPAGRRLARVAAAGGVALGVFVLANLPFAIAKPQGWWLPFSFQATRPIDASTFSVWYFLGSFWPGVDTASWARVAAVATATGIGVAAVAGWLHARRSGAFPLLGTSISMLVAYLLLNKVHSPQYILWLLPLLVLSSLRTRALVVYLCLDVVMFWSLGFVLYTRESGLTGPMNVVIAMLLATELVRMAYLAWIAVASAGRPDPALPSTGEPV
jgi:uncharacterized membrane protein